MSLGDFMKVCIHAIAMEQVLASEIGATVTGINAANFRQYLLELAHAVAAGKLLPAKYAVGMKASGIPVDEETPLLLAEILW